MKSIDLEQITDQNGGGIIGALFSLLFVKCFDVEGSKIVTWVLLGCGFIMFTGKSLYDIIISFKSKVKIQGMKKHKKEIKKVEEEYENDNKIVVSSIADVINISEETKVEEHKIEEVDESTSSY